MRPTSSLTVLRVSSGLWVLEDHGDAAAADFAHLGLAQAHDIFAGKGNRTAANLGGILGQQAQDGQGSGSLARTGLTHKTHGLTGLDGEADAVDGLHRNALGHIFDPEIFYFQ